MVLIERGLPAATMNAARPVDRPAAEVRRRAACARRRRRHRGAARGMVVIQRGGDGQQAARCRTRPLETLMENCDDAYGFPPYPVIEDFLHSGNGADLRASSATTIRAALAGVPATLLLQRDDGLVAAAARSHRAGTAQRVQSREATPSPPRSRPSSRRAARSPPPDRRRASRRSRRCRLDVLPRAGGLGDGSGRASGLAEPRTISDAVIPRRSWPLSARPLSAALATQRPRLQQRRGRLRRPGRLDRARPGADAVLPGLPGASAALPDDPVDRLPARLRRLVGPVRGSVVRRSRPCSLTFQLGRCSTAAARADRGRRCSRSCRTTSSSPGRCCWTAR